MSSIGGELRVLSIYNKREEWFSVNKLSFYAKKLKKEKKLNTSE